MQITVPWGYLYKAIGGGWRFYAPLYSFPRG